MITAKDLKREGGEGYEPSKGSFCPLTAVNGIAAKGFHGTMAVIDHKSSLISSFFWPRRGEERRGEARRRVDKSKGRVAKVNNMPQGCSTTGTSSRTCVNCTLRQQEEQGEAGRSKKEKGREESRTKAEEGSAHIKTGNS